MKLEKVQGNALFETIVAGGLDPIECRLKTVGYWPGIVHPPSRSHFKLRQSEWSGKFIVRRVVSNGPSSQMRTSEWADVLDRARKWAEEVRAPDFWADLRGATEFLASAHHESSENTPFTAAEQTEISDQLRDIKEYVKKTYSLSAKQMSRVEARLDEAEKASRRMGRKDWLLLFSGTLFTLIVTDLVPPDVTQHIFMMALHGLSHMFGADAKPIPSIK